MMTFTRSGGPSRKLSRAGLILLLCGGSHFAFSQCASAPVAAAACSGGNGAASSGTNINSGNTYWFSGGPATFAGINLNSGGTLRVCGHLTLSGMSFNGGTLIVENGGNLTINTSMSLSGITIINRGTLTINGSVTIQGSGGTIYNDLSTSVLTISGTLTLNGTTSFVINRGIITANTLLIQGTTGSVCLQDNAMLNLTQLDNNFTNSISYSGTGYAACLNVSTTAVLNNDVASSPNIRVCTNATPSGGAAGDASKGWGSAVVTNGCSSCATVLLADWLTVSAVAGPGIVQLHWTTSEDPADGDIFFIERAVDGVHFSQIGSREAIAGEYMYTVDDTVIKSTRQYYRIRLVSALTGVSRYSPVAEVETGYNEAFSIFPNPAIRGQPMTLLLSSPAGGLAQLELINPSGQAVNRKRVSLAAGKNRIDWEPGLVAAGVYFIRIATPGGGTLYGRLLISGGSR